MIRTMMPASSYTPPLSETLPRTWWAFEGDVTKTTMLREMDGFGFFSRLNLHRLVILQWITLAVVNFGYHISIPSVLRHKRV